MATALQQQLAVIAANSTHQLDLKAQKARHSKSLLFEPRDAATQSFDTIYQICYEGFEELCMLDARFRPFARNIFSEQSKNEDRTQMTAQENGELDKTVESFLGLVGGRMLLKPALKAVEWLVRRFRVQEHNAEAILLTFLPYHTSHIFPTLLSILPEQLPATFRWLHPYAASLQSPPRHAVLGAAIGNQGFFAAFSQYTLRVAKARHHSAVLIGFWASVTAQAVNGMIDSTRSGRDEIRKQREEDLLLRTFPILQCALSIKGASELYLGACMILTILATKASLEDKTLDAIIEAIASPWTSDTIEHGLICLAVIMEEKGHAALPRSVLRAILNTDGAIAMIERLSEDHRTEKLVLGLITGCVSARIVESITDAPQTARRLLKSQQFSGTRMVYLVENILNGLNTTNKTIESDARLQLLVQISNATEAASAIKQIAQRENIDLQQLSPDLILSLPGPKTQVGEPATDAMEIDQIATPDSEDISPLMKKLPVLDGEQYSFLDASLTDVFEQYLRAFCTANASESNLKRFKKAKCLQKVKSAESPRYLTFLARAWTTCSQIVARLRAIELATSEIQTLAKDTGYDFQALLPYVLIALADESQAVRRAAAQLMLAISRAYGVAEGKDKIGKDVKIWCADTAYPAGAGKPHQLSSQDAFKLIAAAVAPALEACILDCEHMLRALADSLDGKDLKQSTRSEICLYLGSHAVIAPALRVKLQLLATLSRTGKIASEVRRTVLLPFVKHWVTIPSKQVERFCLQERVSHGELDRRIVGSLSHRSADELQTLKWLANGQLESRDGIQQLAFEHLRHLWPAMKSPSQVALADFLLDLTVSDGTSKTAEATQAGALDILRNLSFPTEILVHLVESLPNATDLQDQPSSAKKRRTSSTAGENLQLTKEVTAKLNATIRRTTIVLELLETSKPGQHPQLLKGLFHLLAELHHFKTLLGSPLVYLQGLLMSCLLTVVNALKGTRADDIDTSVVRADLIVETVRTTTSSQVHNTALLLIGSLASWEPELVLHSIMPLFTFMSTTLLRQSDEYSAHVTDQTVARIVPPLAESLKRRGQDLVSGAAELLLSFTAAFEHIPLHRRAGLFQHLVQTLGPEESLFAIIAMLAERHPDDDRIQPFVNDLIAYFPVATQMKALKQYLDLVFDNLSPRPKLSKAILSVGEKDAAQINETVDNLLETFADLLQNTSLRKQIGKEFAKGGAVADRLRKLYAEMLEQTMQLGRKIATNTSLKSTVDTVLAALLRLTPTKDFIDSSAELIQAGSNETRGQIFNALEARVSQAKRGDEVLQQTFLEILPGCCLFVDEKYPVDVRRAAISCIDQIAEKYGKRDRATTLAAAKAVSGAAGLKSDHNALKVSSILCLTSMVEVLGDEFIPLLPPVLSKVLEHGESILAASSVDVALHNAVYTFATQVLDSIAWMFSAQYLDRAMHLAGKSAANEASIIGHGSAVESFRRLAPKKLGAQELFGSVDRTLEDVCNMGAEAANVLLQLLEDAVAHHSKATITKNTSTLFSIVLKAFDLRRTKSEDNTFDEEVFARVDQIAMAMVLKLNDATFSPFFTRLVEWASNSLPKKDTPGRVLRSTSLFSFAYHFFKQLKMVVTRYASYLLEPAAEWLNTIDATKAYEQDLLRVLLSTLTSSFEHDQDQYWQAPAHLEAIASPLISRLSLAQTSPDLVVTHIIPAIAKLAGTTRSPEHHKNINTQIMQFLRHDDAAVRLAAVRCEIAVTREVLVDWLSNLAEMIPYISELQEDDDRQVENTTLEWVKEIEGITGESLQAMLT
ncbi:U3 small nucleolar RNA-associated protein 10 [Teratosphaeria destructans]|uniref:U3 small nucleolar RNA-associated protein 10 n=1 Tax=Teratosphaeria destructans TaxID=418781 RepID=A0A9W7SKJ3_9PEZI|nr:U3 small nucleolar RNA-associated protein 10 [Teratosphaeria destructans]